MVVSEGARVHGVAGVSWGSWNVDVVGVVREVVW
jgi:hypothetical protein